MTPTREEVERLAKRLDVNAADWRWDGDHHAARDMLRALADERDAERQLRIKLERQRNEANAYGDTAIAERDAARAEAARLREALGLIERLHIPSQPMAMDMDEVTWAQRHVGNLRGIARKALRAALTVEARDE